jgi:flagellar basal-body rod protein FlgB
MPINDLPALSMLRTKMQWHQERQHILAENVSNSNMPNFKPRDLVEPKFEAGSGKVDGGSASLPMTRTSTSHLVVDSSDPTFGQNRRTGFLTRPAGNAVNLEDEMLKTSANQMDYAAVTSLYSKSLHLLKTAIGKG